MKKILIPAFILLAVFIGLSSCEKDDICPPDSAITPELVIRFYDATDPTETKLVNNIRVYGLGQDTDAWPRSTTDSISLPLKSFENSTTFVLVMDSEIDTSGNELGNIDTLTYNYVTKELFISRGCGYVNIYNDLGVTNNNTDTWISSIQIVEPNVENQNQAHVQIFH